MGFEPTMSNLPQRKDSAPMLFTLLTNNDSSTFYSQHRGIVYNLAHLTAVWELKFIVFFLL